MAPSITYALGWLAALTFYIEIIHMYDGYPGFCRLRVLGSLQFFLEHGLFQISLTLWLCLCATCKQIQGTQSPCVLSHAIKTCFHWKGFALNLVFKVRVLENGLLMLWWKVFPQVLHCFRSYLFIIVHLIIFSMFIGLYLCAIKYYFNY